MKVARHPYTRNPPLPMRDGVSPSFLWLPHELETAQWPTMLSFLLQRFAHIDEAAWRARMARGEVRFADGVAVSPEMPFQRGQCVFYYRELEHEPQLPFAAQILYQDAHILVADKPHFLPVTPGGRFVKETLLVRLKQATGLTNLTPLHRLDRETAGLVLFSHNLDSRGAYQSLFQKRAMQKTYLAVAPHCPTRDFPFTYRSRLVRDAQFFRMQETPGEANSETLIEQMAAQGGRALYRLQPYTGRQHQLRVHMAVLGMPIENDGFYPRALPPGEDDFTRPLQLLASELAFDDPLDGRRHEYRSRGRLNFPLT